MFRSRLRPAVSRGMVTSGREVPLEIVRPDYSQVGMWDPFPMQVHDENGIKRMRAACALAREVLDYCGTMVKPGTTTEDIDAAAHDMIILRGAYPSPLGYMGYPKAICTSVNNVAVHGIPDDRPLCDGDIINVDVSVFLDGYHGDNSDTFVAGECKDDQLISLLEVTRECLSKGIEVCAPGVPFREIGRVIGQHAARHGFSTPPHLCGHGIGTNFHCEPMIVHAENADPGRMVKNSTFTIEPVVMEGSPVVDTLDDDWTMVSRDGGYSAQKEHTILISDSGAEVLTTLPRGQNV